MNNYKKISVVNEFNEEKNEWEIKTIVIFRDGDVPIIENYDPSKHLEIINGLLVSNEFDFLNNGVNAAIEQGILSVIARNNTKEMSALSSEIIQEQIKYSTNIKDETVEVVNEEKVEEKVEEKPAKKGLDLAQEDRELAAYFRLNMLKNAKQLPPVGLAEIDRLASVNERVAALEEASKRLSEGRLSQEEYDRLYSTYREQLATAIKVAHEKMKAEQVEEVPEVERTLFNDEDAATYEAMMEVIDLCREARVDDEKFEVVIDRGLNDHSKREVRISLLNGIARDSYSFEFQEGTVFDQYLTDIIGRVSLNDDIVDVKQTPTTASERIANSISLYTTNGGNQVLIRYGVPVLAFAKTVEPNVVLKEEAEKEILNEVEPSKVVINEKEDEKLKEMVPVVKKPLPLSQEDRELADYFRKDVLRTAKKLPPVGLAEIDRLASVNERVAALEEARRRMEEGKLTAKEYNNIRDLYRAELASAIKKAALEAKENEKKEEEPKVENKNEQTYQKRLALSKDDRELSDYFRKSMLRRKGQLPPVGLAEIDRLASVNERVAALEEAVKRLEEGRITKNDLEKLHSMYRAQLAEAIKEASKNKKYENVNEEVTPIKEAEKVNRVVAPVKENENLDKVVAPVKENENLDKVVAPVKETEKVNKVVAPVKKENENKRAKSNGSILDSVKTYFKEKTDEYIASEKDGVKEKSSNDDGAYDVEFTHNEDKKEEVKPEKKNSGFVAPIIPNFNRNEKVEKKPGEKAYFDKKTGGIDPTKPVQTKGKIVVKPDEEDKEEVVVPVKGKVTKTNKLKQLGKYILAGIVGIGAFLGINKLVDHIKDKFNTQHNQNQNVFVDSIDNENEMNRFIANYGSTYDVPAATMNFLMSAPVTEFLSQYKNPAQVTEVLSALCYGYEANILTTKSGNFRLDADGNTYLRSFTNDFLCAKVVVNGYTPEQMLAVFGDSDITYEQLMDGFKGYLNTVSLYGTTAVEPLPFRYLTNNNPTATNALNNLFSKLSVVNANRKAGTLNSLHTDAFIVAVDELFVQNDQSLGLTEGTKMVAAAMVDSYIYSQSQVANGEALYLHGDYGLAKAGLNLQAVDGHFAIVSRDGTAYHFTNLLDVVNYGYGDISAVDNRCLTEQQVLLENLSEMRNLANTNADTARISFANALYKNGLKDYALRVSDGKVTEDLLRQIEATNPALADEIEEYQAAVNSSAVPYVPFEVTVDGVDRLLGIKGYTNDLATLHNIRRNMLYLYNDYEVVNGKWYTGGYGYGYGYGGISVPGPKVVTTTKTEKVDYEDLTDDEKVEVQEQIEDLQQQEQQQHQEQLEQAEDGKDALREAVANGATQEQLEVIGSQYGIDVDPDYQANMSAALEAQQQGEELGEQLDQQYEQQNEQARRDAEERARAEAEEQARRKAQQQALINAGNDAEVPDYSSDPNLDQGHVDTEAGEEPYSRTVEPVVEAEEPQQQEQQQQVVVDPQIDPNRVDTEAGEEPYVGEVDTVGELTAMRDALVASVDVADLDIDQVQEQGKTLTRNV